MGLSSEFKTSIRQDQVFTFFTLIPHKFWSSNVSKTGPVIIKKP